MIYSLICEKCNKPFESKRAHATTCSSRCRVALAREAYKKQAAEDGSPDVVWQEEKGDPESVEAPVTPPAEPCIELRKKLPPELTPLRADCNSLARQVIASMKQMRPLTELELLEKNQLKK